MDEKRKAVSFNSTVKTKSVDDERRIVFVASSNGLDRHYEHVDVQSLRLPKKSGGAVSVKDIDGDLEDIDIPLMLNHSADVSDVIGSVRKAYTNSEGELVFEAGISSRQIAQDMLTLIDEGHLSNAFSITMSDFDYDTDTSTILGAEVIEVSLVYRGSNKEARLLAVKSILGGETMAEAVEKALTPDEVEQVKDAITSAVAEALAGVSGDNQEPETDEPEATESKEVEAEETEQPEVQEGEAETPEVEEKEAEVEAEATETETEETTAEEEDNKEEEEMEKAKQALTDTNASYLQSSKALADFRAVVTQNHRASSDQVMKEWAEVVAEKGVTGDAILPASIEQIFFKTWGDEPTILNTFRFLGKRSAAVYAAVLGAENGTAKGHKKGEDKVDQELELVRRDIKALCIYKKLPIDLQDLFDDETGELLRFRVEELAERVAHAIAVGAIVGSDEYLQDGRGLNPMTADLDATEGFGAKVATVVEGANDDDDYTKAIKTLAAVKDNNRGKVLIVKEGFLGALKVAKTATGYLFPATVNVEDVLGAKVYEVAELADSDYEMIAYANQSYVLAGQANADVRTDFDLTKNQDIMLVERYVAGSTSGYKTVAGYKAAA